MNLHPARTTRTTAAAILWLSSVQFFLAQAIVQSAWTTPFSLTQNFISDLGNTACAPYPLGSDNYVCSPWHFWMNASFLLIGLTIPLGAALARHVFRPGLLREAALVLLALAGPGFVAVSLYPENVAIAPHKIGAGFVFVSGNLGLALLGVAIQQTFRRVRLATALAVLGIAGFIATVLLVTGRYLGIGIGGIERVAAYPLPVGLIMTGYFLLRARRSPHSTARPLTSATGSSPS